MSETEVLIKKQYRIYTAQTLARYFKVDKKELINSVDMDNDEILLFPTLEQFGFEHPIYVGRISSLDLSKLFNPAKFEKGKICEEFIAGESKLNDNYASSYIMALSIREDTFVMYRANGYKGLGGVFLTAPNEGGFVIEPIKNFLEYRYKTTDCITIED